MSILSVDPGTASDIPVAVFEMRRQVFPCPTCDLDMGNPFATCLNPFCREADSLFMARSERLADDR